MRSSLSLTAALAALLAPCTQEPEMERTVPSSAVELPAPPTGGGMPLDEALRRRRSERQYGERALRLDELARLLWAAQGVTSEDGLRTAPSAGALYPLEVYVAAARVEGLADGVHRYVPARHRLVPVSGGARAEALAAAALDQDWVREAAAVIVLAAVHERTAVKYGRRAERYVAIEVGHAAQNVYLEATSLGLGTVMVGAFDDEAVHRVLGLPEGEDVLALMPVGAPVPSRSGG